MPDDLGEYDAQLSELGHHRGVVNEVPDEPYRGTLAGLFAQRRVLLDEIKAKLRELVQLNEAVESRAQMVIAGYTGVGRLGRWLQRRAWKRIFRCHDVSLSSLLSDMPKGHCAERWECGHREGVTCDDAQAERLNMKALIADEKRTKPRTIDAHIDEVEAQIRRGMVLHDVECPDLPEECPDPQSVPSRAQPTHAPGGGTIKQG